MPRETVECAEHGAQEATFVCRHLARSRDHAAVRGLLRPDPGAERDGRRIVMRGRRGPGLTEIVDAALERHRERIEGVRDYTLDFRDYREVEGLTHPFLTGSTVAVELPEEAGPPPTPLPGRLDATVRVLELRVNEGQPGGSEADSRRVAP